MKILPRPSHAAKLLGAGRQQPRKRLGVPEVAAAEGTWERLKACPAEGCHWACYDFSRNHSRTWCTMSVCGNRAKARTYWARQPKASE